MSTASHALARTDTLWFPIALGRRCMWNLDVDVHVCACGATVRKPVAPEASSGSSRSPATATALTSASSQRHHPRRHHGPPPSSTALRYSRTIAAMATADERELQINPIVASSVQHNTQVRLHTSTPTPPPTPSTPSMRPSPALRLPSSVPRIFPDTPALSSPAY